MGQCIYVAESLDGTGEGDPVVREMRSEEWMDPAEAGRILAEDHLLNTSTGVWFYESDLWDKRSLRRRLTALVRHVTSPTFLAEYEEWGRRGRHKLKAQLSAQLSTQKKAGLKTSLVGGKISTKGNRKRPRKRSA